MRHFLQLLNDLQDGRTVDEAERALADVRERVVETGKAGKLVVTLVVKPATKGNPVGPFGYRTGDHDAAEGRGRGKPALRDEGRLQPPRPATARAADHARREEGNAGGRQ